MLTPISSTIASKRSLAITLTLLLAPLAACGDSDGPAQPPAEPVLHTFTSDQDGFDTHSYYLDTGAEVVVFDAQFTPALAQALVDDIRAHRRHRRGRAPARSRQLARGPRQARGPWQRHGLRRSRRAGRARRGPTRAAGIPHPDRGHHPRIHRRARRRALLGSDAAAHQAALSERIAAAYPDHALPYMTQFSIYGLATALASEIAPESQRARR